MGPPSYMRSVVDRNVVMLRTRVMRFVHTQLTCGRGVGQTQSSAKP